MRNLFTLAAVVLIGCPAFSQTSTTPAAGGLRYGVKGGVNLSKYSFGKDDATNPTTSSIINFHVTGYLDAKLAGPLYIQPGISLQGKGGEWELPGAGSNEYEQNTMWVEVPVNFVGKFPLGASGTNFFLGAGPYAAFGISGEKKVTLAGVTVKSDVEFGKEAEDDLKGIDLGVNLLTGVQLANGFNVGAGYGLGLSDLRPTKDGGEGQMNHRVWSFSVGYAF